MSTPELERLIADVKADKDLQDNVKSLNPTNEAIVEWANAHGYDITLDELDAYIRERRGELTAEELNRVVGGRGLSYDWNVSSSQGVSRTFTPAQLESIGHDMFIAHPAIEGVSEHWALYKDAWTADKAIVQDTPPDVLIDEAPSHGATVDQAGGETNVTFTGGVQVQHDGQAEILPGQVGGFTEAQLAGGGEIYHGYVVSPSGEHQGEDTAMSFTDGVDYQNIEGEKSFSDGPRDLAVKIDGHGEFSVSSPRGDSTLDVTKTPVAAEVTVTTDQGSAEYQVTAQEAEQDWAAQEGTPEGLNQPGTDITVQSGRGWTLDHTDVSGPETTFTDASGNVIDLPHARDSSDWTITNSQGESRTFTPEQIYHGEVNWLVAHPRLDHLRQTRTTAEERVASARQTAVAALREAKQTAGAAWAADKTFALEHAQGPEVQVWEHSFEVAKGMGGGTLLLGGTIEASSYAPNEWTVTTHGGMEISWGGGSQWIVGSQQSGGDTPYVDHSAANSEYNSSDSPYWMISTKSGDLVGLGYRPDSQTEEDFAIPGYDAPEIVYNRDNPEEPWSIESQSTGDGYSAPNEVTWGPGQVSIDDSNKNFSLEAEDGHIVAVGGPKAYIEPGSGDFYLIGPAGNFSIKPISVGAGGGSGWLISSPYGEQWTIEKGDEPYSPESAGEHPSAHLPSGLSVHDGWAITTGTGQATNYTSEQLLDARSKLAAAHPDATQGVDNWITDKGVYELAEQALADGSADPQAAPEGEFAGAKGEVSYSVTPSTDGSAGYDVRIDGPDTQISFEPTDAGALDVHYQSDLSGHEVMLNPVFWDGHLDSMRLGGDYYVWGGEDSPSDISGPQGGEAQFQLAQGADQEFSAFEATLPDGSEYGLSQTTTVVGPHGRSVEQVEMVDADPEMIVTLQDGTKIEWQRSDETHSEDGIPIWHSNLEYFDVVGQDQSFDRSFQSDLIDTVETVVSSKVSGGGGLFGSETNYAQIGLGYDIQAPHATVELVPEEAFSPVGNGLFSTDEAIVEFNDGLTLVHQPHFTEVFKGTLDYGEMVASDSQPVELRWEFGQLDEVKQHDLSRPVEGSFETASGGTATVIAGQSHTTDPAKFEYQGPGGNVLQVQARYWGYEMVGGGYQSQEILAPGGKLTYSLDGVQIVKGQDVTMMGPDGRVSVEWDVPSSDLPDGFVESGTNAGFVVTGPNRDVQVVPFEQGGYRAWAIDNDRVFSAYSYTTEVQTGEVDPKAVVTTNMAVFSQLAVWSNEAEAVDTTTTVQVEVEVEVLLVAGACLVMT